MNVTEYTAQASSLLMPIANDRAYLIPMIVGETGELFGQRAKAVWHQWTPERLQLELVSEYGDIAWGTAILMQLEGSNLTRFAADHPMTGTRDPLTGVRNPWQTLLNRANDLHYWYTERETHGYIRGTAEAMWVALEVHCQAITGVSFEEVLNKNLAKLHSRAERGTLIGSGDHR